MIIAMENADVPGYVTEKVLNAFLAGAIPIQWGATVAAKRIFNPAAMVSMDDFPNMSDAAKYIAQLAG